jgi:hypothetical protein
VAIKPLGRLIILVLVFCCVGSVFGQNWSQEPQKTSQARTMVQNAPRISPINQFYSHFTANTWSKPKTKMQNGCLSDSKIDAMWSRCIKRTHENENPELEGPWQPPDPLSNFSQNPILWVPTAFPPGSPSIEVGGFAPPPQSLRFPKGRDRSDPTNRVSIKQGCSVSVRVDSCRDRRGYLAVRVGSCRAFFRVMRVACHACRALPPSAARPDKARHA